MQIYSSTDEGTVREEKYEPKFLVIKKLKR